MEEKSVYTLPVSEQNVKAEANGASVDDVPSLDIKPCPVNILRTGGHFPYLTWVIAYGTGIEQCGVKMPLSQRLRHGVGSVVLYSAQALVYWIVSYLVFGFSNNVSIGIAVATFANFMLFMVPYEEKALEEPLLAYFLKTHEEELKKVNQKSNTWVVGLTMFVTTALPLLIFVSPVLISSDFIEQTPWGMQAMSWASIFNSIWVTLVFAGWGPLEDVLMRRFGEYLSKTLIDDYYDLVYAELINDRDTIAHRRKRLGLLYEKQGKFISQALKRGPNVQNISLLFFYIIWIGVTMVWLFPQAAGELPDLDRALAPPLFRIVVSVLLLLSVAYSLGFSVLKAMSKPHALFEERLRSEIGPHAPRLHKAVQLFGTSEELWCFINAQEITMSLFGVPINSELPGKIAPIISTIIGATAWSIARSYEHS